MCLVWLGRRQNPQASQRAGLKVALGFPGRLWGLAVWINFPEAPAGWMLAACMVLLLSGESWAKHLDAFDSYLCACQWF